MVSWEGDGGISGFSAYSSTPTDVDNNEVAYLLASPGMVDVEGVTRLQYTLDDAKFKQDVGLTANDRIDGRANFNFTIAERDAAIAANRYFAASMFIAKASDLPPGTPSRAAVLAAPNLIVYRAAPVPPDAQTHAFVIHGPRASALTRNTKYWVLIMPTSVPILSSPSPANDVPLDTGVGRGLSMWTNRPPLAPTITSPLTGATAPAGAVLDFTFQSNDPDRIVGQTLYSFADLAGVEVQYRAQPSAANLDPAWQTLPIAGLGDGETADPNTTGYNSKAETGPGWYINGAYLGSPDAPTLSGGAFYLWNYRKMPLDCSRVVMSEGGGQLPSGAWQLRMRTFDFGHPYPLFINAFAKDPTDNFYTPADAPAANTSPWSATVDITISEQVPAPIPQSPINGAAVVEGAPVTLSWLYRNTYVPAYQQAQRTVQIRRVGETDWVTLVSGNGGGAAFTVPGTYALTATHGYEWRVQVTDAGGVTSAYSQIATFWVVPAPVSGPVRVVPTETVDGATLGTGTHRVFVYRRGGKARVGELTGITHCDWNRVRDDISDAKIVIQDWGTDCGDLLRKLQCWAYEIVIFRDNGFSVERVWEGPITLLSYEVDSVTINAKDVMAYAYRRIIKQALNDSGKSPSAGDTVTSRATRILQYAFAPDDPNVLAYLTPMLRTDDAKQYRNLPPYSRTAFEEVDDMAANAGLDYTCSGRSILLWGTKHRIGTLPEFRDADLGAPPIVSEYGMSMANRYVVSDGNGVWGEATRGLDVSGNDPTYGLVEMLSSTWASESDNETGTYTETGIETVRKSFVEYADRSIGDRYPPPVVVRVPDNTTLNPGTVLSIQQLVPGVVIPLRSTGTLRSVVASQKLDKVQVTETSGGETIAITLSPFSRDDAGVVEGEA